MSRLGNMRDNAHVVVYKGLIDPQELVCLKNSNPSRLSLPSRCTPIPVNETLIGVIHCVRASEKLKRAACRSVTYKDLRREASGSVCHRMHRHEPSL